MIVELLINVADLIASVLAWLLPDWKLPDFLISSYTIGYNSFMMFNVVLPLVAIFNCLMVFILYYFFLLMSRLAFGLISLIRGGGKIDI